MPTVQCKNCRTDFYAKPFWIKKGYGNYCSTTCQHEGRRNGKSLPCTVCGKETYKKLQQIQRSKSGMFFCGRSCQAKWRNQEYTGERHGNWKDGKSTYRNILKRQDGPQICVLCRTEDTRVLAVHHIDKNHGNNAIENLAWLCHNCHFLVHHDEEESKKFKENLLVCVSTKNSS